MEMGKEGRNLSIGGGGFCNDKISEIRRYLFGFPCSMICARENVNSCDTL